ncbi:MAG: glycosyltransferase [Myxococcota bacterium]|nr:glycosyltransferase [Myxococcota bacterium]
MSSSHSRRHLVLFTQHFPYGNKETFVELELPYLAEAFDTVRIVPAHVQGASRRLPSNVVCDDSLASISPRDLVRQGVARANIRSILRESKGLLGESSNAQSFVARSRRLLRFLRAAQKVVFWFGQQNQIEVENTLFYSYWLEATPVGLAFLAQQNPSLSFVCRTHRWDLYEELYNPAWFPFRNLVLEQTKKIFSISADGVEYLQSRHPLYGDKVELSRLGVHSLGTTTPSSDQILRIVSCSGLTRVKRVNLIIEALNHLDPTKKPRVEWHHFGDGPLAAQLQEQARTLLGNSVRYTFHGHTPNQNVRQFYVEQPVDLFINVSDSEGVPVSVMEAQSAGIPVIATDVGGTSEIVNEDNGVLIPAQTSPEKIAAFISGFLNEPAQLEAFRKKSNETWHEYSNATQQFAAFAHRLRHE